MFSCYTFNVCVALVYVYSDKAMLSLPLGHCVALQIQLCLVMLVKLAHVTIHDTSNGDDMPQTTRTMK